MKDWTLKKVQAAEPGRHCVGKSLYMWVSPGAQTRRFMFRFTKPSTHRVSEFGLGTLGVDVSLAQAHDKRNELRSLVRKGGDPVEAKREAKIEARQTIDKGRTFESVANEFITLQERKYRNAVSTKNLARLARSCKGVLRDGNCRHWR
jgi:hypothetical protein